MTLAPAEQALALLAGRFDGVLASVMADERGYPFASRVPCCLDVRGAPLLVLSRLAQHTRNVVADPRASLLVWGAGEDVQAAPRLTLIGDLQVTPDGQARRRYLSHFPHAGAYLDELDFDLWRLSVVGAQFIAGFAQVHRLEPPALAAAALLEGAPADVAGHPGLQAYCARRGRGESVAGVDPYGLTLRAGQGLLRIAFDIRAASFGQVLERLGAMRA